MTSKSKKLIVRESEFHSKGVFTLVDIPAGSVVEEFRGKIVEHPTRYTIQLGQNRNMDVEGGIIPFVNHSCEPNTRAVINGQGSHFEAVRHIKRGEEITFNYLTTELDMASPFVCTCGKPDCTGEISGFKHIPIEKQQLLLPLCSEFIVDYYSNVSVKKNESVISPERNTSI